jgi:hypothetical protein
VTLELDLADLERAVGRPVTSYDVQPIDPHLRIHSVTGGVYRVRGDGFSLVVKVVRHGEGATPDGLWGSGAEPSHRNYWKREWLAFDTGLLEQLPGRLRAPRRLLTTERDDRECWIWMEDVAGRTGRRLQLEDYGQIAYALGTTQGAFVAGAADLPDAEWLSRGWLRGWVDSCARLVAAVDDDAQWSDDRLRGLDDLRPRIRRLWEAREDLLAISEAAPATVSHWDFWPANLHVDGADVVAVDWSQVGIGCLAQDLDQITLDTVWMQVRPDESIAGLERLVLDGYLRGLVESGCAVDGALLRHRYAASAAARYAWMGGAQPAILADPDLLRAQQRRYDSDYSIVLANKTRVVEHAVRLGEWALESAT